MLTDKQKEVLMREFEGFSSKEITIEQVRSLSEKTEAALKIIEWFALDKGIVPCRYNRHIGSIGIDGQKKLLESKVVVVGLGGLGGFVCEHLARAGIGKITVIDPDVFDQTNLNRQLLANNNNIGKKKTAEAKKRIKKINPAVEFKGYSKLFSQVPKAVWSNADLVFDCLDNIQDRILLAQMCSKADIPMVHGAIAGWFGQVAVIWPDSKILDKIYSAQTEGLEKQFGTPAFTAATAASIMTAAGIKVLLGKITKGQPKILCFDLMEDSWQITSL